MLKNIANKSGTIDKGSSARSSENHQFRVSEMLVDDGILIIEQKG